MLKELYEAVHKRAREERGLEVLENGPDSQKLLLYHGDGTHEQIGADKPRPEVRHRSASLASFIAYLCRYRAQGGPVPEVYVDALRARRTGPREQRQERGDATPGAHA